MSKSRRSPGKTTFISQMSREQGSSLIMKYLYDSVSSNIYLACSSFNPDVEVTRLGASLPNLLWMYPITLCMKHIAGKQDISSVIAEMGRGSCTGTCVAASWNVVRLLEAGLCAKHELSSLQIHSLEMVVIPPIHSNLIWQKVVCMTELRASIGGVEEGEVNDAHSRETK